MQLRANAFQRSMNARNQYLTDQSGSFTPAQPQRIRQSARYGICSTSYLGVGGSTTSDEPTLGPVQASPVAHRHAASPLRRLRSSKASVSSTLSIIGRGAVAKSASVRAPWAKLHGRIAVICLPASTASLRTAQSAPHCKDKANHNGQAAGLHTCHEQIELQESCQPCLGTATKPAARPARSREQ